MNKLALLAKWHKTREISLASDICEMMWNELSPEERKKWEDEAELD